MADAQAVPPLVAAIAGMVATRYSGQPTQRDLDVANVAAAAERERIRNGVDRLKRELWSGNGYMWPQHLADLLEGDTDGQ